MFKSKNKKQLGFTLVELLIVVAIIGILSAVAITNLNSTKEKAKDAVVKDSLNSILRSVELCLHGEGNLTNPIANTDICDNNTYNKWPDLTTNNWTWESATSDATSNTFCYTARKNDANPVYAFRCKQNGCYELIDIQPLDLDCNPVGPTP